MPHSSGCMAIARRSTFLATMKGLLSLRLNSTRRGSCPCAAIRATENIADRGSPTAMHSTLATPSLWLPARRSCTGGVLPKA